MGPGLVVDSLGTSGRCAAVPNFEALSLRISRFSAVLRQSVRATRQHKV